MTNLWVSSGKGQHCNVNLNTAIYRCHFRSTLRFRGNKSPKKLYHSCLVQLCNDRFFLVITGLVLERHYCKMSKLFFQVYQQDATLYNILYYCRCSTCFRRFLRPSSGAQKLYTQHRVIYPMLCVQFWAPDDGWRNRTKHVQHWQ